jgi:predicted transcriptional regulator
MQKVQRSNGKVYCLEIRCLADALARTADQVLFNSSNPVCGMWYQRVIEAEECIASTLLGKRTRDPEKQSSRKRFRGEPDHIELVTEDDDEEINQFKRVQVIHRRQSAESIPIF